MQQIGYVQSAALTDVRYETKGQELPYRVGDVLSAEVLKAEGGKLLLRLDGGPVIRATSEEGVTLKQGDIVSMQVTGRSDEGDKVRMSMRLTEGTSAPAAVQRETAVAAALARIGAPAGENAALVAYALARSGHAVTASTISSALDILAAFPRLNAEQAAFLALNANAVGASDAALPDAALVETLLARVAEGENMGALLGDMAGEATAGFSLPQGTPQPTAEWEGGAAYAWPQHTGTEHTVTGETAAARPGSAPAPQPEAVGTAGAGNRAQPAAQGIPPETPRAALERLPALVERLLTSPDDAERTAPESAPIARETMENAVREARALVTEAAQLPPEEAAARITAYLERTGGAQAGGEARAALGALLEQAVSQERGAREGGMRSLLGALERVFDDMREGITAEGFKRAVKETPGRVAAARDAIAALDEGARALYAARGERAAQHVRLSHEVQQFLYVQVPMEAFGRKTAAELYVMQRDPRRRPIDPEHVTMLIALDTERMGRVETMMQVERREVTLKLRVEDEARAAHVKSHAVQAHRLMREAGYTLRELSAQLIKTPIDPANVERVLLEEFAGERRMLDVSV